MLSIRYYHCYDKVIFKHDPHTNLSLRNTVGRVTLNAMIVTLSRDPGSGFALIGAPMAKGELQSARQPQPTALKPGSSRKENLREPEGLWRVAE
jgi:hypothetical protein